MTKRAVDRPSPVRTQRLEARVSADQKALFQRAADLQGRTLTDFVVASVNDAAVRALESMRVIELDARESRAFAQALSSPREPGVRLKQAARRYVALTGGDDRPRS